MAQNDIFAAVRLRAVKERDYFAVALYSLYAVERPGLGTMAVDKYGRVYWDPDMIGDKKEWSVQNAAWVLIHEIGHWLRKHHERAEPILAASDCAACEMARANIAMDAELNDDLVAEGAVLPGAGAGENGTDKFVTPKVLGLPDDQLWEYYYHELKKRSPPPPQKGGGKMCDNHQAQLRKLCGSSAHGQAQDYELPAPDGKGEGSIGESEGDLLRRQVAKEIQASARTRGSVPAGWSRWADTILEPPQVPWERELAALVKNAVTMTSGSVDYSYQRPSRRHNGQVIMPAMRRPAPEATVVLDTSGSMDVATDIAAVLCEIQGIIRAIGQHKVQVICCDSAAAPVQRVTSALNIEIIGGGGTDMGVGIAEADRIGSKCTIVCTDGYTPWPPEPPRAELVVCIVGRSSEELKAVEESIPSYVRRVVHITSHERQAA